MNVLRELQRQLREKKDEVKQLETAIAAVSAIGGAGLKKSAASRGSKRDDRPVLDSHNGGKGRLGPAVLGAAQTLVEFDLDSLLAALPFKWDNRASVAQLLRKLRDDGRLAPVVTDSRYNPSYRWVA